MRKYIDYAIYWDFLIAVVIGAILAFSKSKMIVLINVPSIEDLSNFGSSLISVCATLIGFLLTIITVIVTFKKAFEDKNDSESEASSATDFPRTTVFEQTVSKENKFYGSDIHKRVVDVFVNATCEIGIILLVLLTLQFNIISITAFGHSVICFCIFLIMLISIARSLYIFKLFLNIHIHEKQPKNK